ncbi:phosphoribosyltransferase family protein [Falsibacillus albus]|uniref:Adenine/guanine phosphoribosyltransferase n=1 Tax=Falsibacillus albus TaxID=2478915 RepID=A0A3L7JYY1_9BACI|nr:phosphoribosyltransferase family protein [Falsibacillus albus]RLQ95525.1 adenine/guanine phosphoribosyltransferase [Falsibacillus albus]
MGNHSSISLEIRKNKTYSIDVIDGLRVKINIDRNPYQIPLDSLFEMAARINKKRGFLFVSKLLGKHIPVNPRLALLTGGLLASRFMEKNSSRLHPLLGEMLEALKRGRCVDHLFGEITSHTYELKQRTLFIGFAETATALGHAMFNSFENSDFFHTTREDLTDHISVIDFEEEHSHATSHRCYIPKHLIDNHHPIVLVDDELTTGKTALNIIESIHRSFPRKQYHIVSILDWRSEEDRRHFKELEKKLNIQINEISLVEGTIEVEGSPESGLLRDDRDQSKIMESSVQFHDFSKSVETDLIVKAVSRNEREYTTYLTLTGRFGFRDFEKDKMDRFIQKMAKSLSDEMSGDKALCLGTGEFMYVPMRIAAEMGEGVNFQSTTRSPIFHHDAPGYGAKQKYSFESPEHPGVRNFFYNVIPGQYEEVFIFFEKNIEREKLNPLLSHCHRLFKTIHIVTFGG